MRKYLNRQFVEVKGESDYSEYLKMALSVHDLFFKPNFACMGRGIFTAHIEFESDARKHFDEMIKEGGRWIVEQKIKQCSEMASWNESSVNTIRYYSFLDAEGNYSVQQQVLRTGRRGSYVDNAGSGGVLAVINPETGIVYTNGIDEQGRYYDKHPDSGIQYKGWKIPRWQELKELVKEAHLTMLPNHHYLGWDWALTDNGWTLIEANWGQFLPQYNEKIGLKDGFLEKIGIKK